MLNSKQLRLLIVSRSQRANIPLRYLCAEAGVDYALFMKQYINSNAGRAKVTEEQFIKMLGCIGVSVRYQFVINENFDIREKSVELANKYGKEERVTSAAK